MARRRRAEKRPMTPDTRFGSELVARLINCIMERGKKSTAERIVYGAFDQLQQLSQQDPMQVFQQALDNIKPQLEVKSRRVGGATYQVPVEVSAERGVALAMRWILDYAGGRKGIGMSRALALELNDAFKSTGNAIKKRDDTHKMAQANKAFAHYRW